MGITLDTSEHETENMQHSVLTFRVFVSSTFSDLKAERDALQRDVFPRLREYCRKHGCRFQAIDLRWGVSEEAALDQQTMNTCLEEIRRCQRTSPRPNFIVLLGQRYGWCPPSPQIPATEFEPILDQITDADDRALLEHWYRRDDNAAPPEYCLQPRRVDVNENQSETEKEAAHEAEAREWGEIEYRLRQILLAGVNRLAWPAADERRLKHEASATHQEIHQGALQTKDAIDHVFGFFRTIDRLPQDVRARDYLDPQGQPDTGACEGLDQLQADMRKRLPNNILTYSATWTGTGPSADHLLQLCTDVYDRLRKVIDEELQRRDCTDSLDQEVIAHQTFGQERARVFIGRQDLLQRIQQYLNGQDRHPLVVHGVSGSGKSALLAKAIADHESRVTNHEVIIRYISATPASSDIRSLLEGLCKEITLRYGGDARTVPMDFTKLVVEFPNRLALATSKKPLVVFLDALDQLSDADQGRNLVWLPAQLPQHVLLVVSTLDSGSKKEDGRRASDDCLGILRERLPAGQLIEVTPMTADDGAELLETWLTEAHRTLQPRQLDEVLTKFHGCPYPLYLKLAFEETRRWGSWDRDVELMGDAAGVLGNLFDRLEQPQQHGAVLVSRALGYLAASRHGLTEDELLDVLSADKEVMADFQKRSPKSPTLDCLPVIVWARLYADIEPYMTQRQANGTTVLTFYHRQVGEAVNMRYMPKQEKRRFHDALATYFRDLADPERNKSWKGDSPRPFLEFPYQLAMGSQEAEMVVTLTDFSFLEVKLNKCGPFSLSVDCDLALSLLTTLDDTLRGVIKEVKQVVRLYLSFLTRHPETFFQTAWNSWHPNAFVATPGLQDFAMKWRTEKEKNHTFCWARAVRFPVMRSNDSMIARFEHSGYAVGSLAFVDGARGLVTAPSYGVSLLALPEERAKAVRLWDLTTNSLKYEHVLGKGEQVLALAVDSQANVVIADLNGTIALGPTLGNNKKLLRFRAGVRCLGLGGSDASAILENHKKGRIEVIHPEGVTRVDERVSDTDCLITAELSADGTCLVTQPDASRLRKWNVSSGLMLAETCIESKISAFGCSCSGEVIYAALEDGTLVRIVEREKPCQIWNGPKSGYLRTVAVAPTGDTVAIGTRNGQLYLVDGRSGVVASRLDGHTDGIERIVFSKDGQLLASGAGDGMVCVWNLTESLGTYAKERSHYDTIQHLRFSPNGLGVLGSEWSGAVRLWSLIDGSLLDEIDGQQIGHTPQPNPMGWRATQLLDQTRFDPFARRLPNIFIPGRLDIVIGHPCGYVFAGAIFGEIAIIWIEGRDAAWSSELRGVHRDMVNQRIRSLEQTFRTSISAGDWRTAFEVCEQLVEGLHAIRDVNLIPELMTDCANLMESVGDEFNASLFRGQAEQARREMTQFYRRTDTLTENGEILSPRLEIKSLGLILRDSPGGIVEVVGVVEGSAAARAGISVGSKVVLVERQPIRSAEAVQSIVSAKAIGDSIQLKLLGTSEQEEWRIVWNC